MTNNSQLRWNPQSINGRQVFFTEDAYTKLLGAETHESRLAERLQKVGITLPPLASGKRNLKYIKDDSEEVDNEGEGENVDTQKVEENTRGNDRDGIVKEEYGVNDIGNVEKETHKSSEKVTKDVKVESDWTGSCVSNVSVNKICKSSTETMCKEDITEKKTKRHVDQQTTVREHKDKKVQSKFYEGLSPVDVEVKKPNEIQMDTHETDNKETEEESTDASATDPAFKISEQPVGTFKRPLSYKGRRRKTVETQLSEETIDVHDQSENVSTEPEPVPEVTGTPADVPDANPEDVVGDGEGKDIKDETEKKLETSVERYEFYKQHSEFFLHLHSKKKKGQEEVEEKKAYKPRIYVKKPKHKESCLTRVDLKTYHDLERQYGHLLHETDQPQGLPELDMLRDMLKKVRKEQSEVQMFLRAQSIKCAPDYAYLHEEVNKYVQSKIVLRRKRVLSYPRLYKVVKRVDLPEDIQNDNVPVLQYVRPLLRLGQVKKLVLPSVLPGMPQPRAPLDCQKVNDLDPMIRDTYKGAFMWNHEVTSQDVNVEQLAVPNLCDVAMSASVVCHLVDNQGNKRYKRHWDIPITVREYSIGEGENAVTHRVAFLDKPMIRASSLAPKDKNLLYHKHAIKAVAYRTTTRERIQKGYTFTKVTPLHTVESAPQLEDVEKELLVYGNELKKTLMVLGDESKDEFRGDGNKGMKGKNAKKNRKKKNLDKNIEDLETFGMDLFNLPKPEPKPVKGKTSLELKKNEDRETLNDTKDDSDTILTVKKKRLSIDDELEKLKLELQGIKEKAKTDSAKSVLAGPISPSSQGPVKFVESKGKESKAENVSEKNVKVSTNWSELLMKEKEKPSVEETVLDKKAVEKIKMENSLKLISERQTHVGGVEFVPIMGPSMKLQAAGQSLSSLNQPLDGSTDSPSKSVEAAVSPSKDHVHQECFSKAEHKTKKIITATNEPNKVYNETVLGQNTEPNQKGSCKEVKPTSYGANTSEQKDRKTLNNDIHISEADQELSFVFADDSDKDEDALVIDLPEADGSAYEPSLKKQRKTSLTEQDKGKSEILHDSDANSKISVETETAANAEVSAETLDLTKDISTADKVITSGDCNDVMETKDSPCSSEVRRKANKRKNMTGNSDVSLVTRRMLRSSLSKVKQEPADVAIDSDIKSGDDADQHAINDDAGISQPKGRDGKAEISVKRVTRSRSVSMETNVSSEKSKRVTRASLGSDKGSNEETIPVKRGRGRPRKIKETPEKSQAVITKQPETYTVNHENEKEGFEDSDKMVTELSDDNALVIDSSALDDESGIKEANKCTDTPGKTSKNMRKRKSEGTLVEIDKSKNKKQKNKTDTVDNVNSSVVDGNEDDAAADDDGAGFLSPKKGIRRIVESEDEGDEKMLMIVDDQTEIVCKPKRRGRPPKKKEESDKVMNEAELKKIKEMAEAMKKKIDDRKGEGEENNQKSHNSTCENVKKISGNEETHDTVGEAANEQTYKSVLDELLPQTVKNEKQETANGINIPVDNAKISENSEPGFVTNETNSPITTGSDPRLPCGSPPVESIPTKDVSYGVDSILGTSLYTSKIEDIKGSIIEKLAVKHGMSHITLPVDDNVTYHQWKIGDINTLIRVKYHGFMPDKGLVHLVPKMEYQPTIGLERQTPSEVTHNWMSIYVRPNANLVRCRVNPFNSEIIKIEHVEFQDLIPPDSNFSPDQAFTDLELLLSEIKQLPVGQYLMRSHPARDQVTFHQAAPPSERVGYDLHAHQLGLAPGVMTRPPVVQWTPIDTRLLLPHHRRLGLLPCMYTPPDMYAGEKQATKNLKRKRNKQKKKKKFKAPE
ncbi:uncharacterized protein LOC128240884 [Mya arenaria]|uniref:uncharacterized protein LOC128240884 n=1 Tax=Mya arenaria TaxID=6604 RepID=UPI0022E71FBB|nr:uncharacterized protein LOC128240884 [Mya arenaria]